MTHENRTEIDQMIAEITTCYEKAKNTWTGNMKRMGRDDIVLELENAENSVAFELWGELLEHHDLCVSSAKKAEELAADAMQSIKDGNLTRAFDKAWDAADLEKRLRGKSTTWGQFAKLCLDIANKFEPDEMNQAHLDLIEEINRKIRSGTLDRWYF